ncbi:SIR2 family NAD-dependent protein deacylase [Corticicoccus populi]|uniref:SIR2 family protein n=1 Tax=Corticicoccus populi TaxID=1812821 RepID=A0ABW5WQ59_9STAP
MDDIKVKFKNKLTTYNHLKKIRDNLWPKIGSSKVSIMVGAGFSLNARKLDESLDSMSTWSGIKERIEQELDVNKVSKNLNVLEIAEEYVNEYGRANLDDLLKKCIPDEHYEPHDIHKKLLKLPWSEVYTTNYDTLLERTLPDIVDQRYSVVQDVKDIPSSTSPRIVKLHGSFPSIRPFIFTKKDFDEYNKNFAPFVNMVQQSIMENTFILLGFSGEDPNFEQWIKWVRSNLGDHMPRIYMLAYDEGPRRKELENNGITVIDFKEVYGNQSEIYETMFKDIFEFFSYRDRKEEKDWPYLPYTSSNKNISLLDIFIENHNSYPGWIVLPETIRRNNIETVQMAVGSLTKDIVKDEISIYEKINIVYEINWVNSIFSIPIDIRLQKIMENLVDKQQDNNISLNATVLKLLTEARMNCDVRLFKEYVSILKKQSLSKEFSHQLTYELIQFEMLKHEYDNVKSLLENWYLERNDIEWIIKKAVIHFKIGEANLSKKLLGENLETIRNIIARNSNHKLLSLEGITLTLLLLYGEEKFQNFKHRLEYLESELSNPLKELESLYYSVKKSKSAVEKSMILEEGYDPNSILKSYRFRNTNDPNFITSYRTIKLYDEFGLTLLNSELQRETINLSLINQESYYPFFTWSLYLRIGDYNNINQFFSRNNIRKLKKKEVRLLATILFNEFDNNYKNKIVLELLSRIYFVLNENEKKKVDKIVFTLFTNTEFYKTFQIGSVKILEKLFNRIVYSKNKNEKEIFIVKIYDLPILGEASGNIAGVRVDKFNIFDPTIVLNVGMKINLDIANERIDELLLILENGDRWCCDLALQRLNVLFETGNLNSEYQNEFKKKLKKILIEKEFRSHFLLYSYLLVIIGDKNLQNTYLETLLSKPFPVSYDPNSGATSFGGGLADRLKDLKNIFPKLRFSDKHFIDFNNNVFNDVIELFFAWWDTQQKWLLTNNEEDLIDSDNDLLQMINFLRISLLSNMPLENLNKDITKKLLTIYESLNTHKEKFALMLIPVLCRLRVIPENNLQTVYNGLTSNDGFTIESSIAAMHDVFYLIFLGKLELNTDLRELKKEILNVLKFGNELSQNHILKLLITLLNDQPNFFSEQELELIIDKLNSLFNYYSNDFSRTLLSMNEKMQLLSHISNLAGEIYCLEPQLRNKINQLKEYVLSESLPEVQQFSFLFSE